MNCNMGEIKNRERVELKGYLSEFREALEEEIKEIKKNGQVSILLSKGRKIENGIDFQYCFKVEYAQNIPADTPCKLIVANEQFDVTVISFDEDNIIIMSKVVLPENIESARLENGSTVLMERLIKCIEDNADKKNTYGTNMLSQEYTAKKIFPYSYGDIVYGDKNNEKQNEAIFKAVTNDITYIWGPPGTGKTSVIGQIAKNLWGRHRSVLIVSHTNTAVDGAIHKIDKEIRSCGWYKDEMMYPILRIGNAATKLPDSTTLEAHIKKLGQELYEQKETLENIQAEKQKQLTKITDIIIKDNWRKENKLYLIQEILENISNLEKYRDELEKEIRDINVEIKNKQNNNLDYNYQELIKLYENKKNELETIQQRLSIEKSSIKKLESNIKLAENEMEKADKYEILCREKEKYPSELTIRNNINKVEKDILHLKGTQNNLNNNIDFLQTYIEKQEKKNALLKLFSDKNILNQKIADLQESRITLSSVESELQEKEVLINDYKKQLEFLLLLENQIKIYYTSKTKSELELSIIKYNEQLETTKKVINSLGIQENACILKINKLEKEKNIVKELEYKKYQIEYRFNFINKKINNENEKCSNYIKNEFLLCNEYRNGMKSNKELYKELFWKFMSVESELREINIPEKQIEKENTEAELREIFGQLNDIKKKMSELEKQAVMSAQIIGTTLSKSYLSDVLRERTFDTVIIDEASMASIPALWCASYLAENSIVIVGDFLQLSPIVVSKSEIAQKWLGKDIFYHSGMQEKAKYKETCPSNFVMLNQQYRMESDIADIANMYYGEYGRLISNDTSKNRIEEREKFYEWYPNKEDKRSIHLIDTESLHAWVTGIALGNGHSRLNTISANIDVALAFKFLENDLNMLDKSAKPIEKAKILIVAPYRPHIKAINNLIEVRYKELGLNKDLNYIKTGTIHSFQGDEADIVIFDLVVDEPHWKANLFMNTEETNSELEKMFNVAVTRAKFKLFVVGNFNFCQKRAKDNALSDLIDKLINKDNIEKEDAEKLFPKMRFSEKRGFVYNGDVSNKLTHIVGEEFYDYLLNDINNLKERLIIFSPFMAYNRLSKLLPYFIDLIKDGKKVIVITKEFSEREKDKRIIYEKCERELRYIGVQIIYKRGMHEKIVFVDDDIFYSGSLNTLSFNGSTGEIMVRICDKNTTLKYEKDYSIEPIYDTVENEYKQKCPICGEEMSIRESAKGGIYWECSNCKFTRNPKQPYPKDGVICCEKCGAPYIFDMKKEPRWICSQNPRHYKKVKESDLKLEKMAALIPNAKLRKEVDKFFNDKRKDKEPSKNSSSLKTKKTKNIDSEQLKLF